MTAPHPPAATVVATALVLFTRVPVAGRVKTRLAGALSGAQGARLQEAMAYDAAERLARLGLPLTVRYSNEAADLPDGAAVERAFLDGLPAPAARRAPQTGAGLGERMGAALEDELARGAAGCLLMGSDLPLVTEDTLRAALAAFDEDRADVLLGPSDDGGYWLVGLRAPFPELFAPMAWGGAGVLDAALARCRDHGRSVALGPTARDVDTPADLAWLASLVRAGDARVGPHTATLVRELGDAPPPPATGGADNQPPMLARAPHAPSPDPGRTHGRQPERTHPWTA